MKRSVKQCLVAVLVFAMVFGTIATVIPTNYSMAAKKKPTLSSKKVTIEVKAKKKITVKGNVKIKSTKWSIANKKVASLSKKSKKSVTIKGLKKGKTKVTAKVKVGKKTTTLKCNVTVNPAKKKPVTQPPATKRPVTQPPATLPPAAYSITFNEESKEINVPFNSTVFLESCFDVVTPEASASPAVTPNITWHSSNTAVATIDEKGKVSTVADKGTTNITASISDGKGGTLSDTCSVTVVKNNPSDVIIDTDFSDKKLGGWSGRGSGDETEDNTAASINLGEGKEGTPCLQITGRKKEWNGAILNLSRLVEPGASYELEVTVRLAQAQGGVAIPANDCIYLSSEQKPIPQLDDSFTNLIGIAKNQKDMPRTVEDYFKQADPAEWTTIKTMISTPDDIANFGIYFETGRSKDTDIFINDTKLTMISRNEADFTIPSLYDSYKEHFKYFGAAIGYPQLMGDNSVRFVKNQFNSITMGNEMKPSSILPNNDNVDENFMTEEEAKAAGYWIPTNYKVTVPTNENRRAFEDEEIGSVLAFPKLNLESIDETLEKASKEGLKLRYHALLWHQQMPIFFFKQGYRPGLAATNCSATTMNSRIEYYVKNVMLRIVNSPYSDVVYAVDVLNEHLHSNGASTDSKWPTFFNKIYNEDGSDQNSSTPEFGKFAFKIAHDVLVESGKRDKISLFYNDYNEYDIVPGIVNLYNWLNTTDDLNPQGEKLCDGVGMQSHLGVGSPTIEKYRSALEGFSNAGMEIQVTELDVACSGTEEQLNSQASYYKRIMQELIDAKAGGANITSVTVWGLYDGFSWKRNQYPLPFDGLFNPKPAFFSMIEAAKGE